MGTSFKKVSSVDNFSTSTTSSTSVRAEDDISELEEKFSNSIRNSDIGVAILLHFKKYGDILVRAEDI